MRVMCLFSTSLLAPLLALAACSLPPPPDVEPDADPRDAMPPDAMVIPDPAMLTVSPGSHDFTDVTVGADSGVQPLLVRNTGDEASGAVSVTLAGDHAGDFEIVLAGDGTDCAGAILDGGEDCTARVRFSPTAPGARTAHVEIAGEPGGTLTVDLMGNGLTPGDLVVTSGDTVAFGNELITMATDYETVTVQNTGDTATAALTVQLGDATSYSKTNDTCHGAPLGAGQTCSVQVRFNPTAVGATPSTLSIRESSEVGVAVTLTGTGTAQVQMTAPTGGTVSSTPSGLSCGPTCGPVTFTQSPITLTASPGVGSTFTGWSGACSAAIGTTCALALTQSIHTVGATFDTPEYTVGGAVSGMWDGAAISLRLQAPGVDETKQIVGNSAFTFDAPLVDTNGYTVTIAAQPAQHTCMVSNGTGSIDGADVTNVGVSCAGPTVGMSLSLPVAFSFNTNQTTYSLSLSRLAQQVRVRPTLAAATSITVNGTAVQTGVWSDPVALSMGANTVSVVVTVGSVSRTYALSLNRGASAIAQYAYGKASNTGADDKFGISVAVDGDVMVVGAPFEDSSTMGVNGTPNEGAADSGAVYIYRRTGATWSQEAFVKASNTGAGDRFGERVAVSGDVVVVGAGFEDGPSDAVSNSGAVYVFRWNGASWGEEAYLRATDASANASFGGAVDISGDAIVVGAWGSHPSVSGAGYFFRRVGGVWEQHQKFQRQSPSAGDMFGTGVAIDGALAAIGGGNVGGGEARVIRRSSGGVWNVEATYTSGSLSYGSRVAVHEDRVAIADISDGTFAGAVHIKRYNGGLWVDDVTLRASNADDIDTFGASIDWSGSYLLIGATDEDGSATGVGGDQASNGSPRAGAAYVFERDGSSWSQIAYVKASNTESDDTFGICALTADSMVVGALGEDSAATGLGGSQTSNGASSSGAVYTFR